ncbi:MAG: oligosaccharide flippase family protein [Pseudomonadales bacterium]|nr:oligosaccharide flippase family protein [Pseudomonadales bacterium]
MNYTKSLLWQWSATIYVAALSFGLIVYLGRVLGPSQFGILSFVLSIVTIYAIAIDAGYRTVLFREGIRAVSTRENNGEELMPKALGHAVTATILGLFLILVLPFSNKMLYILALLCMFLATIVVFNSSDLKAKANFEMDAKWQVSVRTITAILILGFVSQFESVESYFGAWFLGLGICLFLPMAIALRRMPRLKINKKLWQVGLWFMVIDMATVIYFRSDIIMLRILQPDEKIVGEYAAAYRILEGIILLMAPVAQIAFRALRLEWNDLRKFGKLLLPLFLVTTGVAILIVGVGRLFSEQIVLISFGGSFTGATDLINLLLLSLIFILPNSILTQGAIALNKEKFYGLMALAAMVVNLILNYVLIPEYGASGAAWATLVTEGVLFLGLVIAMIVWIRQPKFNLEKGSATID